MKTKAGVFLWLCLFTCPLQGQETKTTDHVIEGSKVVVELIKALSGKKSLEKGCKDAYADICIINETTNALTVTLFHRENAEQRELVIPSTLRECCLRIAEGVWTYDLRLPTAQSIRKGDILIEDCQNLQMNIR
jgi:hypothetical protein